MRGRVHVLASAKEIRKMRRILSSSCVCWGVMSRLASESSDHIGDFRDPDDDFHNLIQDSHNPMCHILLSYETI